jgi:histidinol dehydrogenase
MTIRKFEQEAIVNQIMEGVKERLDNKVEKARKSKDYKAIEKLANAVLKINKERDLLEEKHKEALERVNLAIKNYNNYSEDSLVGINGLTQYTNAKLEFFRMDWKIKNQVADKVTVALIKPNAKSQIEEISKAIAKEVS